MWAFLVIIRWKLTQFIYKKIFICHFGKWEFLDKILGHLKEKLSLFWNC